MELPDRPFDVRTPSNDVKEQFKAELGQKIAEATARGLRVFWIDESHFATKAKLGRARLVRGLSAMCKIKPYGKRCTCFAALGAGGTIHHRYYGRGNTECMIGFVRSIREKYGKALLVMDNASYHKSWALMGAIETYGRGIHLEYLSAYSPDLNPVEMVWQYIKKYIANGIYPRVNDMTKAMDGMLQDGTAAPSSLPGYALRAIRNATAA